MREDRYAGEGQMMEVPRTSMGDRKSLAKTKHRNIEEAACDISELLGRRERAFQNYVQYRLGRAGKGVEALEHWDLFYHQVVTVVGGLLDLRNLVFFQQSQDSHPLGELGTNMPDEGKMSINKVFVGTKLGICFGFTAVPVAATVAEKVALDFIPPQYKTGVVIDRDEDDRAKTIGVVNTYPWNGHYNIPFATEVNDSHDPAAPNLYIAKHGAWNSSEFQKRTELIVPIVLLPLRKWNLTIKVGSTYTVGAGLNGAEFVVTVGIEGLMATMIGTNELGG